MENLFESSIGIKNQKIESLLQHLTKSEFDNPIGIEKETIYLLIYDVWSVLEMGPNYKTYIQDEQVKMNVWRFFVIDFIASNKEYQKNLVQFINDPIKNFFIAVLFVKKSISDYLTETELFPKILEERQNHFNEVISQEKDVAMQQQLLTELTTTWLKELNAPNDVYEALLLNAIEQTIAAEQLLGECLWKWIDEQNFEQFLSRLENNHFSEVQSWKRKFLKEKFLQGQEGENITFVFCVQQDVSMVPYLNFQTALGLTISEFSKEHQYDLIFLPFAQHVEQETIALKGNVSAETYFELLKRAALKEGPISYKNVLNFAFTMLKLDISSTTLGKIILLCNELIMDYLPYEEQWKIAVEQYKREMNIEITVIYVGDKEKLQPIWFANQVILDEDIIDCV